MRTSTKFFVILLTFASAVTFGRAERRIHEVRPLAGDGTVSIELLAGSVRFEAWSRSEVEIDGTIGSEVEEVDIDASDDEVAIEVVLRRGDWAGRNGDAQLTIRVPAGARIEAETISADVEIDAVLGELSVESVSGSVEIRDGADEIEVETVSGRIVVEGQAGRGGHFETVSGTIEFSAPLDPNGRYEFEAVSGSITLKLPGSTSADFSVETFSGDIDNELGPRAERTSRYTPAKSLRFATGGGGARVEISSFSGTVRLMWD